MRCDSAKRRLIAALGAVLVLLGCTHVHPVDPAAQDVDLDDLNGTLADREVRVRLVDDTELFAGSVRVSADSVFLRPQMPREARWRLWSGSALPLSEVRSLEVTRGGRGARDGARLGMGIGIAAGAAIYVGVYEANPGGLWSREASAVVGGIIGGVLGTCLGVLIGANVGSKDVYELTGAPGTTGYPSPGQ